MGLIMALLLLILQNVATINGQQEFGAACNGVTAKTCEDWGSKQRHWNNEDIEAMRNEEIQTGLHGGWAAGAELDDEAVNAADTSKYDSLPKITILPEEFDARQKWPFCSGIGHVPNQGHCASCWAIASAAAFSDRLCIKTQGEDNTELSAAYLVACCNQNVDSKLCKKSKGCKTGSPSDAAKFWDTAGLVSGSDNGKGCLPYSDEIYQGKTPSCSKSCADGSNFEQSRRWAAYHDMISSDQYFIQKEMYLRGPVTATFHLYQDMYCCYKGGVYSHTAGNKIGAHAVKLIGWGVDESSNRPYWLAVNSWGEKWGSSGLFKILRGKNEVSVEDYVSYGIALDTKDDTGVENYVRKDGNCRGGDIKLPGEHGESEVGICFPEKDDCAALCNTLYACVSFVLKTESHCNLCLPKKIVCRKREKEDNKKYAYYIKPDYAPADDEGGSEGENHPDAENQESGGGEQQTEGSEGQQDQDGEENTESDRERRWANLKLRRRVF